MRFHHFEDESGVMAYIDLDRLISIADAGLDKEGFPLTRILSDYGGGGVARIKAHYREVARLAMGKAPEAEPAAKFQDKAPASTTYRFTVPGITSLVDVDLRDVLDSCEYSWQETRLMFRDGRPSLIVIMPPYKVADLLLKARSS